MTNDRTSFLEFIRRAKRREPTPAESWFRQWCDNCGEETRWVLTVETDTQEGYTCQGGCHGTRLWTVR